MKHLKKQFKGDPLLNPPPQRGGGKKKKSSEGEKTPSLILPLRKGEEGKKKSSEGEEKNKYNSSSQRGEGERKHSLLNPLFFKKKSGKEKGGGRNKRGRNVAHHSVVHKPGSMTRLKTGRIGEEIARKYLERKGYKIIEQNYKTKYGEIDLVTKKDNKLIFIEVRTKRREDYGLPEDTIDKRKLRKVWLNARAYIAIKKWQGLSRIDAICIILRQDNSIKSLNHYENVV